MLLSEGGITIAVLSWSLLILPFYAYILDICAVFGLHSFCLPHRGFFFSTPFLNLIQCIG
jgi:hypothetical protein